METIVLILIPIAIVVAILLGAHFLRKFLRSRKKAETSNNGDSQIALAEVNESKPEGPRKSAQQMADEFETASPPGSVDTRLPPQIKDMIRQRGPSMWQVKDAKKSAIQLSDPLNIKFMGGINCVNSNYPVPNGVSGNGVYYYEIKVMEKEGVHYVALGLSTVPYPDFRLPGWAKFSIGYHSSGRKQINRIVGPGIEYGKPFEAGAVVGCGIDFNSRTIFFTLNGQNLGPAGDATSCDWAWNPRFDIFPCIGSNGASVVAVNFGTSPFAWDEANKNRLGYGMNGGSSGNVPGGLAQPNGSTPVAPPRMQSAAPVTQQSGSRPNLNQSVQQPGAVNVNGKNNEATPLQKQNSQNSNFNNTSTSMMSTGPNTNPHPQRPQNFQAQPSSAQLNGTQPVALANGASSPSTGISSQQASSNAQQSPSRPQQANAMPTAQGAKPVAPPRIPGVSPPVPAVSSSNNPTSVPSNQEPKPSVPLRVPGVSPPIPLSSSNQPPAPRPQQAATTPAPQGSKPSLPPRAQNVAPSVPPPTSTDQQQGLSHHPAAPDFLRFPNQLPQSGGISPSGNANSSHSPQYIPNGASFSSHSPQQSSQVYPPPAAYPPTGPYPPQGGYSPQVYPPQHNVYPPQQNVYPPQQNVYPPQNGYHPQNGYPPQGMDGPPGFFRHPQQSSQAPYPPQQRKG
ncbi:hypothetical protein BKA69DRAFT_585460 [Paraphysoderma sedebokerense]|nr:hypothetical protein BKA69DRAFT_585460 [Paraphysoderma sedebokerense]